MAIDADVTPTASAPAHPACRTLIVVRTDGGGPAESVEEAVASPGGAVEVVSVGGTAQALAVARSSPDPIICMATDRRGVRSLPITDVPLLVLGPRCRSLGIDGGEVMVCLDGSRGAEGAVPVAAALAAALDVGLCLLSVVRPYHGGRAHERLIASQDVLEGGYLAAATRTVPLDPLQVSWEVLHGKPAEAVIEHARHGRAAAIAVNGHGRPTSPASAWGPVAARLVHDSPVPVLLTRVPGPRPLPKPRPEPVPRPKAATVRGGRPGRDRAPARRHRSRALKVSMAAAALLVLGAASAAVRTSYYVTTGGTRPAADIVALDGPGTEPTRGLVLALLVKREPLTPLQAVSGWFDPGQRVRSPRDVATGRRVAGRRIMAGSVARARGVAADRLDLARSAVDVHADTDGLEGPSAGLAFALEMVDALTPDDLTGGLLVAATGVVDDAGRVSAVGGAAEKATAARRAGADLLLVPSANYREAVAAAPGLRVVAVDTFDEAVAALGSR